MTTLFPALLMALTASAAPAASDWPPASPQLAMPAKSLAEEACPGEGDGPSARSVEEPGFGVQKLIPVPPGQLPLPQDDLERDSAVLAAKRTRDYWTAKPPDAAVEIGGKDFTAGRLAESFSALARLLEQVHDPAALKRALELRFELFQAVGDDGAPEGTITAYYDASLPVSLGPATDLVPILARPKDLIRVDPGSGLPFDYGRKDKDGLLVPYYTRKEVSQGALKGRGLELYWTRHATDLLLLQTEGSGWAILPDGSRKRLLFDGANGRKFRAVGQAMIDCGLIPPGTKPMEILRYLKSQPPRREARLVDLNPRYTFFKEGPGAGGPWGASGLELVAGRSIAIDTRKVPMGLAGLLVSRKPVADEDGNITGFTDFTRFVFTHDVGSAIRGPVRVDLFMGSGVKAEAEAHNMLFPGRLYLLVLKP